MADFDTGASATATAPGPPDPLRAALEARRRARQQGSTIDLGSGDKPIIGPPGGSPAAAPALGRPSDLRAQLETLRQMHGRTAFEAARAAPTLATPVPAEATAAPAGAPPGALEPPAPVIRGVSPAEQRTQQAAARLEAAATSAGKVRALVPGAEPASFVERAAGRGLAHLPGAVGEAGAGLAELGEEHGREEAMGRENTSLLARLPADVGNLWLELEAGGRIPGPIGRTIGEGYARPVMGSLKTGELAAPGLAATAERVAGTTAREAARFGTLEATKGTLEEQPPEDVIAQSLASAAAGAAWGGGTQLAREALARAVGTAIRTGLPPAAPEAPAEPPAPAAGLLPPPRPPVPPEAAAPAAVPAVDVENFQREIDAGKYSDADLKRLRARFVASAPEASAAPAVGRVIDAIDTHLGKKGVAGAAPLEPEPAPAPAAAPGAALHDVEGRPIPGTEAAPVAERRAQARPVPVERRRGIPAPVPVELPAERAAPQPFAPNKIVHVPTASITAAPARFQFKSLGTEGVSPELKGVNKWNPDLAGVISVWRDPADGKTYVVNGHHRLELAQRLGVPSVNVQYINQPDAVAARAEGAYINIAEGRGSATDVAKFLRDTKQGPEELAKRGVSIRSDLAKSGVALSHLAPDVFDQVAAANVPEGWGAAIGGELPDQPELQRAALKLAADARTQLSAPEVRALSQQVRAAGTEGVTQETLFGTEKGAAALFVPRAQLAAALEKNLATDKRLFGFVSKAGRPEELARAGGTRIDVTAARSLAEGSAQLEELFTRLSTRSGPLADVLSAGARRIAHGEKAAIVARDAYPAIRAAIESELGAARPPEGVVGPGARPGGAERPKPQVSGPAAGEEVATGVREPIQQEDMFGPPKAVATGTEQGSLLPTGAGTRAAKLPETKLGPEDIARVRREGSEPPGERPSDLFGPGEPPQRYAVRPNRLTAFQFGDKERALRGETMPAVRRPDGHVFVAPYHLKAWEMAYPDVKIAEGAVLPADAREGFMLGGKFETRSIEKRGREPDLVRERLQPYTTVATGAPEQSARLTFGSAERAKAAVLDLTRHAGAIAQFDLFAGRPAPLDPAVREAAVSRAASPHAWVSVVGQRVTTPESLHSLLWAFRSPAMERLHTLFLDANGRILAHEMHTSGVISYVQMTAAYGPDVAKRAQELGAVDIVMAHNHPSGIPTPSADDIDFTNTVGREVTGAGVRLRGHYVIDDRHGTFIEHLGDRYSLHQVKLPMGGRTAPDWTATHFGVVTDPVAAAMIVRSAALVSTGALPDGRLDLLYLNTQGIAVALEPHSLAALGDATLWLPQRLDALAATHSIAVVGSDTAYDAARLALRDVEGVSDVIRTAITPGAEPVRFTSAAATGTQFRGRRETSVRVSASRVLERAERPARGVPPAPQGAAPYPAVAETWAVAEPPERGPVGSAADDLEDVPLPEAAGIVARARGTSLTRVVGALRAVFNPESFGAAAKATAGTIRAGRAAGAEEIVRAQHDLRALSRLVGKLDKRRSVRLWDAAERWGEPGTRALAQSLGIPPAMIDGFAQLTEKFSTALRDLGILEPTIAHYVGRYWAGPADEVERFVARIFGRRPLEGPKTFKKRRSYDLFADGLRAGLRPMTYNFVDSQMFKFAEMQRAIDGRRMVLEELAAGRAKKVMLGKDAPRDPDGEWVRIGDGRDPAFTIYGPSHVELKGEWTPTQEDLLAPGGGAVTPLTVPVFGRRIVGHFYAPPQSAAVWNNALSRGLRGHPIYDALMAPGQAAAQVILGLSGFHGVVISQEAVFSELALGRVPHASVAAVRGAAVGRQLFEEYRRRGTHPELARVLDAMIQGGFRATRQSEFWTGDRRARFKAALRDALHGESLMRRVSGAVRVPFDAAWAAIEAAALPTMGYYVPYQKAYATYVAVERALAKLPAGSPIEELRRVMGDIVKEMDYRFGQVQYDNHFINNVAKDFAQLVFLAPGWTGGTIQLAARGVRQAGRVARQAAGGARGEPPIGSASLRYWLAAIAGLVAFNGALTYLLTGEAPHDKDFLAFRDGSTDDSGNANRYRLPGYIMHDLYAWSHHPFRTLGNKLSPGLHWAFAVATNRTYNGDAVYDPNADWETILSQIAAYSVESALPISVQNIAEARHRGEQGPMAVIPGALGVTPAPREFVATPAQNLMAEYLRQGGPSGATPEQVAQRQLRNDVADRFHRRAIDYSQAGAELRAGGLTELQTKDALRDLLAPPILTRFKQLTLDQAQRVYDLGDQREKDTWGPALFRKIAAAHPRNAPRPPRPVRTR